VRNYDGLLLAFEEGANGRADREIARLLNTRGYRSTGNRGTVPLTKDTVRSILTNRFYAGEIPDGSGGWMAAAHEPLIPVELWERAQAARERNRKAKLGVAPTRRVGSISGVARCVRCGGRVHVRESLRGRQRVECYGRAQGNDCREPSAYLDLLEEQIETYLAGFTIPADYQESILAHYEGIKRAYDDAAARRARSEARLERLKELYGWGDITKEAYLAEREEVQQELRALDMDSDKSDDLARLASFLRDVHEAWTAASAEQKNRLARVLFSTVWVSGGQVVGVEPRPELEPFFRLTQQPSEELSTAVGKWRSRGDSAPLLPYGRSNLYPISAAPPATRHRLPRELWAELVERSKRESLRQLARSYGLSHEAVRGALKAAGRSAASRPTGPCSSWPGRRSPVDRTC
jgi:hypothetical protein